MNTDSIENVRIEKFEPFNSTEAIVIMYDADKLSVDQAVQIYNAVLDMFPDYNVMLLPDYVSLESYSKGVLENIISYITTIIDKIDNREE